MCGLLECTLIEFANGPKLWEWVDMLQVSTVIHRDLGKLGKQTVRPVS